ncbi:uncharacterized protein LOC121371624 [Gigantopelta aegis]|uniref:uncharacterized protein LOC121371624 n=1 Tax=Gigantopelta aegis TaxID=1735272 RepID=UPI001B88CFA7|nr:uncharacterized protein LOC121371624 [Gigantopelta aegis]
MSGEYTNNREVSRDGAVIVPGLKLESLPEVTDPRLLLAAQQSRESNMMLPVIKEELRLRIMSKIHALGKEDIVVDFNNTDTKYELTEAEHEKKRKRREQNRRAAQRCRLKKKRMQKGTVENYDMIFEKHDELTQEVSSLTKEVQELQAILDAHMVSGTCRHMKSDITNDVSPCFHTLTGDANTQSPYDATSQYDVSTSYYDVTNTPVMDAFCTLNESSFLNTFSSEHDGEDGWATQSFRQQVLSTSSTWSEQQDISDIVTEVLDLEKKDLPEDPFEDCLSQSLCDPSLQNQTLYDEHLSEKQYPQQLVVDKQLEAIQPRCSPSPEILYRHNLLLSSEESSIYQFSRDKYRGENGVQPLEGLHTSNSCDQNHFDHVIAEP